MNNVFVLPLVFLVIGAIGWSAVGRRQFLRRNVAGVEEFRGYFSMLVIRFIERIVRFASGVALVMGIVGLATIPGQLNRLAKSSSAAPLVTPRVGVPANSHSSVLISSKCYFYDRNSRLLGVVPLANAPRACAIPAASRA